MLVCCIDAGFRIQCNLFPSNTVVYIPGEKVSDNDNQKNCNAEHFLDHLGVRCLTDTTIWCDYRKWKVTVSVRYCTVFSASDSMC